MSTEYPPVESSIRELLYAQRYAVLGTQGEHGMMLNLMALAFSHDLRTLVVATDRATTKYTNLRYEPRAVLLVDNRSNRDSDTTAALALTIEGKAEELAGDARTDHANLLLARHPQMADFINSPNSAIFRIHVTRYELVRGLSEVIELSLS